MIGRRCEGGVWKKVYECGRVVATGSDGLCGGGVMLGVCEDLTERNTGKTSGGVGR